MKLVIIHFILISILYSVTYLLTFLIPILHLPVLGIALYLFYTKYRLEDNNSKFGFRLISK